MLVIFVVFIEKSLFTLLQSRQCYYAENVIRISVSRPTKPESKGQINAHYRREAHEMRVGFGSLKTLGFWIQLGGEGKVL